MVLFARQSAIAVCAWASLPRLKGSALRVMPSRVQVVAPAAVARPAARPVATTTGPMAAITPLTRRRSELNIIPKPQHYPSLRSMSVPRVLSI